MGKRAILYRAFKFPSQHKSKRDENIQTRLTHVQAYVFIIVISHHAVLSYYNYIAMPILISDKIWWQHGQPTALTYPKRTLENFNPQIPNEVPVRAEYEMLALQAGLHPKQ